MLIHKFCYIEKLRLLTSFGACIRYSFFPWRSEAFRNVCEASVTGTKPSGASYLTSYKIELVLSVGTTHFVSIL